MTSEDIAAVSQIDAACFQEPWPKNSFAYELTTDYSICMVATTPEMGVAAAIIVWLIADEAHIATIAVHPDAQGQGVGACLLAHALLAAQQRGAMTSMLEVRVSNFAAIALYHRFGYHEVGIRKNYYQNNNEDALLLDLDQIDPNELRNFLALKCV
ncbi:MAG: ribosomal protein S18-alanine N-acetyltransferase [Anaerolineaceae bacterium]|jgi:ribosomal-protein-alanine N-acetyltransferase